MYDSMKVVYVLSLVAEQTVNSLGTETWTPNPASLSPGMESQSAATLGNCLNQMQKWKNIIQTV